MVFGAFSAFRISCGGGGLGHGISFEGSGTLDFRAVLCNKAMWA